MIAGKSLVVYMTLPLVALALMATLWWSDQNRAFQSSSDREQALISEVALLLEAHYDGPVEREELIAGSLKGMADAVDDAYTVVWNPQEAKEQQEQTSGKYAGIGAMIDWPRGSAMYPRISYVMVNGPARKAGIRAGDLLKRVDGDDILEIEGDAIRDRVRGDKGTEVTLTIERDGVEQDVTLTRDIVTQSSIQGTRMLDDRTGYLRIDSFTQPTPGQFETAFKQLLSRGMDQLILDLRENRGGLLESANDVADAFIKEKGVPIVSILSGEEKEKRRAELGYNSDADAGSGVVYVTKDDASLGEIPLVLLVNQNSASASEVLAGALQDYGLAFIIGTETYGKGWVQQMYDLPSDPRYMLKVTVARYYTPLGRTFIHTDEKISGVHPDVLYPLGDVETADMLRRFNVQAFELPEDPERDIVVEADREAWLKPDPHIEAALAYFRGEKILVPLSDN